MSAAGLVSARDSGDPNCRLVSRSRDIGRPAGLRTLLLAVVFAILVRPDDVFAGPYLEPGDVSLRHDIQLLADHGVIRGPVTTWPLAWGPILSSLRDADAADLPPAVADAYTRVRSRGRWETRTNEVRFNSTFALADEPTRMRAFQNTPRGDVQVSSGAGWTGDWLNLDLNVQAVDSDQDSREARVDSSMIGIAAGNWTIAASTQNRWWGPGWDGSLILSSNARPIPSLVIDRVFTDPFETKWLSWLGHWDLTVLFGQLEADRAVSDAQFFGMRFNFRPTETLEIGVSRTALWCGDERPCGFDTFVDLFLGRDNVGDSGIGANNEPGNQLAGFDARWKPRRLPVAFYAQLIGEDEAGGLPSRYLGQFGAEWSGMLGDRWSTHVFGEFAGTSCQFNESSEIFNCAYNHPVYSTGYRYRQRAIGHPADGDARVVSLGTNLSANDGVSWHGLVRYAALNRGGPADSNHSLTPTRQDVLSIDLTHDRRLAVGSIRVGVGYERIDDDVSGTSDDSSRVFIEWRSGY